MTNGTISYIMLNPRRTKTGASELTVEVEKLKSSLPVGPYPVARPVLIVVCGLPGAGKSYFSRLLAEQVPLLVLESDSLRKVLFPRPTYDRTESTQLFRAIHILIAELLEKGVPVLFDATNLVESHRQRLYLLADRPGAKLVLIQLTAPPSMVRERLEGRAAGIDPHDHSDADWQVYLRMQSTVEPIMQKHLVVDTSTDISPAIQKVLQEIESWTSTSV